MFPNIVPQARRNSGGLLMLAGLVDILKLLDGLALVFGVDEAINRVHIQIAVAFMNHEFISPQAECRKKQPTGEGV
jgi:hypothetical protein